MASNYIIAKIEFDLEGAIVSGPVYYCSSFPGNGEHTFSQKISEAVHKFATEENARIAVKNLLGDVEGNLIVIPVPVKKVIKLSIHAYKVYLYLKDSVEMTFTPHSWEAEVFSQRNLNFVVDSVARETGIHTDYLKVVDA